METLLQAEDSELYMTSRIDLSVVTGTYNRLNVSLKNMVESVRSSIGVGIPYEIVLVDGGSTDGTQEWAKSQSDIVLIEQGELLGAIKAFNAGLYAARGRYCVVGNDDITYVDETLLNALSYMEDNPDVGIGCFYQDRDHPDVWDLSYMPAVINNRQMQHIYGQVCIVPKWLGDDVGWWGNFLDMRTYGGDNNLSSFVLERGYRVTGIPCACIHDLQTVDDLRRINNEEQILKAKVRGHPDSNAWGKHWTHRNGTCGPILTDVKYKESETVRQTRFLYLPIYEQGHHVLQKAQKRGLREALAREGMVYEFDWLGIAASKGSQYMLNYFRDILDSWNPHIVLTQIHSPDPNMFNADTIFNLRKEYTGFTWVNWNGDYHPEDLLSQGNLEMVKRFDLQCVVTTMVRDTYAKNSIPWMYWQIGYEDSIAEPDSSVNQHDVVFLANGYSKERIYLAKTLRSIYGVNVGIYGSWGGGVRTNGSNLYNFDEGRKLYRAAKISIGDNQWGDTAVGFVSNRLFQAMSAGHSLYMQQRVPGMDTLLGLKDGVHYIEWKDLKDLKEKVVYWLDPTNESKRKSIADAGERFIREHHSFDARVRELMGVLS